MFAVNGWSVSADTLRPQVEENVLGPVKRAESDIQNGVPKKSRKRKRSEGPNQSLDISKENLGDLWKTYIEKKDLGSSDSNDQVQREKQKKNEGKQNGNGIEKAHDLDDRVSGKFQKDVHGAENVSSKNSLRKNKRKRQGKEPDIVKEEKTLTCFENLEPSTAKTPAPASDGKLKYEERKAEAVRKREHKDRLQANGMLPPTRPGPNSVHAAKSVPTRLPKPLEKDYVPDGGILNEKASAREPSHSPKSLEGYSPSTALGPPPASAKLTPLQQRMAAKLTSARFRHLNQTLYTSPSDRAMRLFADSPDAYSSYHAGFRAQVAVWPQNPVEGFIQDIKSRGSVSIPSQKKMWREQKKGKRPRDYVNGGAPTSGDSPRNMEPLPRNRQGTCTIADLGCGDATLAASLLPLQNALNLNILSFDLAKGDSPNANLITVADISNLSTAGITDGSVDIAICCLSLMGTNWLDVINECTRIIRAGGEIWVAEIKSRFAKPSQVAGKKTENEGAGKRTKKRGRPNDNDQDKEKEPPELVEIEEIPTKNSTDSTDVSPFVTCLKKRNFNLKGEADMSNKMFVRIRFVKALKPPGRNRENEQGGAKKFGEGFKGKQRKFLDEGEDFDEKMVLKPCVYKTR